MTTLAELRELEAKATPGPWRELKAGPLVEHSFRDNKWMDQDTIIVEVNDGATPIQNPEHRANTLLIDATRNLLPELLDLWEAATEEYGQPEPWKTMEACGRLNEKGGARAK